MSSTNGTAPQENGIEAQGLVREFKGGIRAVDGVDLSVEPGQIYGFLGPNGAGKSTMVHMLTTLLPPTSGRPGLPAMTWSSRGRRCATPSEPPSRRRRSIRTSRRGSTCASRGPCTGSPGGAKGRAEALIARVGLTEAADRKVSGYSGGMKRRLDLALALLHGPRVLFLDEPTTGLDIQSRTALWDEVARLSRDEGVTVFLTTQYLEEADQLADHVGIIDRGVIVAEGTPQALKAQVGRPTVEVVPADQASEGRGAARALRRARSRHAERRRRAAR